MRRLVSFVLETRKRYLNAVRRTHADNCVSLGSHCGFVDFKSPIDIGLDKLFARTAETF
jgi:hypothetical protein